MSRTVIECKEADMLSAFMHAALFFTGAAISYDFDEGWLLLEDDSDFENQTYTLTVDGLYHKHSGVEV